MKRLNTEDVKVLAEKALEAESNEEVQKLVEDSCK